MEKVDLQSGEVIAKEVAFHSKIEVNLESTNSKRIVFENERNCFGWSLAKFQRDGSNWKFRSILNLDLHT